MTQHNQGLLAPISVGELLDKISILQIKTERMHDAAQLSHVQHELQSLQAVVQAACLPEPALALLDVLRNINSRLWIIEDDIRACEFRQDFGAHFVALARDVYQTNDQRAAVKRQINALSGSALFEEKSYAPY